MGVALFHTADYHIGAYRWVPNYLQRTRDMLGDIIEHLQKASCEDIVILVIAGDFWDRTDLTEQERILGSWFLSSVLRLGVVVIQTLGNHEFVDEQGTTLIHTQEQWAASLPGGNYHVVTGEPRVITIYYGECQDKVIQFLCLPCTQQQDTAGFIRTVALLREQAGPKLGLRYVVMHEAISSARDTRGAELRLSHALVVHEDPDIDGYMLGDIHTRQSFGTRTWYCGAPIQVKKDEHPDTGMLQWKGSVPTVVPLDKAAKFKITTKATDVATAAAEESQDIMFYVGAEKIQDVASLPKNIILDPSYAATDVTSELASIVSSACRDEAGRQLPKFLAELGHPEDEQREAVAIVVEIIERLGIV